MEESQDSIVQLPVEAWREYKAIRLESLLDAPQAYTSTYQGMLEKPDDFWQRRLADAAGEGSWLLFAREGSRVVGMIGAFLGESPDSATIVSVYVTPASRGKGVAGKLLGAILQRLSARGIQKAGLEVNLQQVYALKLYQRFGFTVVKQVRGVAGDGEVHDGYLMEKNLI